MPHENTEAMVEALKKDMNRDNFETQSLKCEGNFLRGESKRRKEGQREGGKEGRREGGKEGRREGGKEGKKERRKEGKKEREKEKKRKELQRGMIPTLI